MCLACHVAAIQADVDDDGNGGHDNYGDENDQDGGMCFIQYIW
jgi:hypothetical protein